MIPSTYDLAQRLLMRWSTSPQRTTGGFADVTEPIPMLIPMLFAIKPDNGRPPRSGVPRDCFALLHLGWALGDEGYALGPAS
jgi:hypothetical protein